MLSAIFLAIWSFALAILLVPLVRDFARQHSWVDRPDNGRKRHSEPTPRLGGLAIAWAYAAACGLSMAVLPGGPELQWSYRHFLTLAPSIAVIVVIGIIDDFFNVKARHKLFWQSCAALLAWWSGIRVEHLGSFAINEYIGVAVTVGWLLFCANGFNLIDGLDGLATGLALIASVAIGSAGLLIHDSRLVIAMFPLAGVSGAFLVFNSRPASIFLGDCGSLWLGFVLGCYSVIWSQHSSTVPGAFAPLTCLSIPIMESVLSILRRFLRAYPIFKGDRGHIHHRLLDRGLMPHTLVYVLYAVAALFSWISLFQSVAGTTMASVALGLFVCLAVFGIRCLDYREFVTAASLLWRSQLRRSVGIWIDLHEREDLLRAAGSIEECWRVVAQVSREFGFSEVTLRLGGERRSEEIAFDTEPRWALHIPLSDSDYVQFGCKVGVPDVRTVLAPVLDVLHRALVVKAKEFGNQSSLHAPPESTARVRALESTTYVRSAAPGASA